MDALRLKFLRTLSTGYQNPKSIIISVLCTSWYLYEWCVAVYVWLLCGYRQNYIYFILSSTLNYIRVLRYKSVVASPGGGTGNVPPPPKPGKFANNEEQPASASSEP